MIERERTAASPDAMPWVFSDPDPTADTDEQGLSAAPDPGIPDDISSVGAPRADRAVVEIPDVRMPIANDPMLESFFRPAPFFKAESVEVPVVEPPVVELPVVKPPVVEAPVVEAPVDETSVAERPVVAGPVFDLPAVAGPVFDLPGVEPAVVESAVDDVKAADTTEPSSASPAVPAAEQGRTFADAPTSVFSRIEVPEESLADALADLLGEPPADPDDEETADGPDGLLGHLFDEPVAEEPVDPDNGSDPQRKQSRGLTKRFKLAKPAKPAKSKAGAAPADLDPDVSPDSGFDAGSDSASGTVTASESAVDQVPARTAAPAPAGTREVAVTVDRPAPTGKRDAANWRESIPYDDTGVLIRPKSWTDDDIETALVDVGPLREALRAAQTVLMPAIKVDEAGALDEELAELAGWETEQAPRPPTARERLTSLRQWRPKLKHGILTAILVLQAGLTLRNNNGPFEDEGLYLYSGHLELAHLVNGAPVPDFATYFSGAPVLYPIAGAIADQMGGLFGARLLSLACLLGATGLLYLTSKRLFGVRSALCAATLFSTAPSAIFVGGLATYDAPALFLLAFGGWAVVRAADSRWPYFSLAVLPVVLAVATKYAALLFVPTIVVLAGLSAMLYQRRKSTFARPLVLGLLAAAMTYGALRLGGADYLHGIEQTTTARATGGTPPMTILRETAEWGAAVFGVTLIGALYYVFKPTRDEDAAPLPGRLGRITLALLLAGTALLAPLNQMRIHTDVSLQKHIGFGLLFAAPLAGYGLVRLVGQEWKRLQFGIGVWAVAFAIGASQSFQLFTSWPDQAPLAAALRQYQKPGGQYLVEDNEPEIYLLRGDPDAQPTQFESTYTFQYTTAKGQYLTGTPAFQSAINAGYFQVVALNDTVTAGLDQTLEKTLEADKGYRMVATIVEQSTAHNGNGLVVYRLWVKV